jgi:hypothetical protein
MWLEAVLQGSSEWMSRLLDLNGCARQKSQVLLSKVLELAPDTSTRVVIDPPSAVGARKID